jgi:hypothetical protein
MRQLLHQRQDLVEAGQSLRRGPQQPEGPSGNDSADHTQILANVEPRRTTLLWRVACNACL